MIPDRARAVIIGAGIAGASIAYHLAKLGWRDVVVVEQGDLVSGTTSHAPGLVGQLRSSVSLMTMLMYSVSLYRDLRVDGVPGYFEVGSVRLASSKGRMGEIEKQADFAAAAGLEASLIGPKQAAHLFPMMDLDSVEGALYVPSDGSATAPILAQALINEASNMGVKFHAHTRVQGINVENGRVTGINTTGGSLETETLVIASGIWSPLIGRLAGIAIPLTPMQHQYVMTAPLPELKDGTVANLRDPDKLVYFRQNGESLVFGGYERTPIPFKADDIPDRPDPTVQTFNASNFDSLALNAASRVPAVKNAEMIKHVNGLESFTPDGEFILGPSKQVKGVWIACGFCAHGVSGSGGVGRVLAEWIVEGKPSVDLSATDPDRFGDLAGDINFIESGATKVYSTYYDLST